MIELRQNDARYEPILIDEKQIVILDRGVDGIDFCLRGEASNRHIVYSQQDDAKKDYERLKKLLGAT